MTTTDAATKPLGRAQREQLDELILRLEVTAMERGGAVAGDKPEYQAAADANNAARVALREYLAGLTDWGRA
jgi:hypothetical protein